MRKNRLHTEDGLAHRRVAVYAACQRAYRAFDDRSLHAADFFVQAQRCQVT